ncbi:hypothetical protein SDRG_10474 [Saprolegnia diclina VS20]|uniref:Uncharacterized protein n=1 Tax=Saprolegnia diclina (strain VS20) TaxID=1156394 RepID=T0QEJ3_SAPDV|nr:hypothetical protein SDRG_10474 [Saprolegnia diclina VS20]EQC31960.1 hypothetical protein SDRG_10474 [Saprolegnia diclina VS20]|eukprot:XP_008614688.1 hypothetical protein SDRG_10474 [Saprolegnia diclina VS20]
MGCFQSTSAHEPGPGRRRQQPLAPPPPSTNTNGNYPDDSSLSFLSENPPPSLLPQSSTHSSFPMLRSNANSNSTNKSYSTNAYSNNGTVGGETFLDVPEDPQSVRNIWDDATQAENGARNIWVQSNNPKSMKNIWGLLSNGTDASHVRSNGTGLESNIWSGQTKVDSQGRRTNIWGTFMSTASSNGPKSGGRWSFMSSGDENVWSQGTDQTVGSNPRPAPPKSAVRSTRDLNLIAIDEEHEQEVFRAIPTSDAPATRPGQGSDTFLNSVVV